MTPVKLYTAILPYSAEMLISEPFCPDWLRAKLEQHQDAGHTIWLYRTLVGVEKIECTCGEVFHEETDQGR